VKIRIPSVVQREVRDAAEYYEAEEPGLGDRFWREFDSQVRWIALHALKPRLRPAGYRRVNFPVFSYYVAYVIREDVVVLIAVAHGARQPEYWIDRME
jgi:plasmid stabilization system protein ParE